MTPAELGAKRRDLVAWILETRKRRREQALFEIRAIAQRERRQRDKKG